MTMHKEDLWVELTVTNPGAVHHTGLTRKGFGRDGGTIGSHGADWILLDAAQAVAAVHCEVVMVDGAFCLIDRSGLTRMNRSESGMGLRRIALLRDGDTLSIGDLHIAVRIMDRAICGSDADAVEGHVLQGVFADSHPGGDPADARDAEDWSSVGSASRGFFENVESSRLPVSPAYPSPVSTWDQPFMASHCVVNVDEAPCGPAMSECMDARGALEALHPTVFKDVDGITADQSLALIGEAGACVRQAVSGLGSLYAPDEPGQRGVIRRSTLCAIEDNPLRLGLDSDTTLRALFSADRSPVFLPAPAAIEEGFAEARRHNLAVAEAIAESLDQVLSSLSPDSLMKRFVRYGSDESHGVGTDAWCWQMYGHYHAELTSPRQNGFARLFWELFDQAYDRTMREREAGS